MLEKTDLSNDILIVIFPVGEIDVREKKVIELCKKITVAINKNYRMIVFAGHSMGCAYAQAVAHKLYEQNPTMCKKIHVVGSGGFIWTTKEQLAQFQNSYQGRYKFFGAARGDGLLDYVLASYPGRLQHKINALQSFDLTLIITSTDSNAYRYKYKQYTPEPFFERPTIEQAEIHHWSFYRNCILAWIRLQDDNQIGGGRQNYIYLFGRRCKIYKNMFIRYKNQYISIKKGKEISDAYLIHSVSTKMEHLIPR